MNYLKVGYYPDFLSRLKPKIQAQFGADKELEWCLQQLSTFSLDTVSGEESFEDVDSVLEQLLAVAANLIRRGSPTLPSLRVERAVSSVPDCPITVIEEAAAGTIEFTPQLEGVQRASVLTQLARAHIPFDPDWDPASAWENVELDSKEEETFLKEIIPQVFGNVVAQFWQPQRLIVTMAAGEDASSFFGQRVDFALETPRTRLVVEIDGTQHAQDDQREHDVNRDAHLGAADWQVIRIPAEAIRQGNSAALLENARSSIEADPLLALAMDSGGESGVSDDEDWAITMVQTPFAVARIQLAILRAMRASSLVPGDLPWKIAILERDISCAELAMVDFAEFLSSLAMLVGFEDAIPSIDLTVISASPSRDRLAIGPSSPMGAKVTTSYVSLEEARDGQSGEIDLLLDVSVFKRAGQFLEASKGGNFWISNGSPMYRIRSAYSPTTDQRIEPASPIRYSVGEDNRERLRYFLQNVFRKEDFWEGQFEILKRSLGLKPVIALLPTGAGKSLCYQLSSLLQPGISLIVDPLRSLMFDQAENLRLIGIDKVEFINSEQTAEEREQTIQSMASGAYQMVFIAPERMQINSFRDRLAQMTTAYAVPYLVIDEAHCVSEWGHDFRTAYLNLAATARKYCVHKGQVPTLLALTGTASQVVLADVQREIGVDDDEARVLPASFDRPNLRFSIHHVPTRQKYAKLLGIIQSLPMRFNEPADRFFSLRGRESAAGIVFVPHVNGPFGQKVASRLAAELNMPIEFYSGGVPKTFEKGLPEVRRSRLWDQRKREVQQRFKADQLPMLVSTKAFGMGIDKPNIRYTIHYGMPQSLESYYQEAGRAGRDRKPAVCVLLFSDDNQENAFEFLDSDLDADDLQEVEEPGFMEQGDVHRMLFFHRNSFRGSRTERSYLAGLLEEFIYPNLDSMSLGQMIDLNVPFERRNRENKLREKALYRLSIVGLVSDYTLDYHARQFHVQLTKRGDGEYVSSLKSFVARYRTREYADSLPAVIAERKGENTLERSLGFLIEFVYEEVEKKRRAAIAQMADVARTATDDDDFRRELLAYLEESEFTSSLAKLAERINPDEWWATFARVRDIDTARQLLGGCRRRLESFPEHPGLLILSGMSRLLLPNPSIESSTRDLRAGLSALKDQAPDSEKMAEEVGLALLHITRERMEDWQTDISDVVLDLVPSRSVAREVYDIVPMNSQSILMTLLVRRLSKFRMTFNEGLDQWKRKTAS